MLTENEQLKLKERFAKNPGILFETLAAASNATPAELIECLPEAMWTKASAEHFEALLGVVATWGKLTTIVHTDGLIMEYSGNFPTGNISHGFYNLDNNAEGLHGHLRYKNCEAIYFVTRPFKGSETKSILFTNQMGEIMFKIFLGRDANHTIFPEQIALFDGLAQRFRETN